ncbi:MAG TPA: hypothetical protein VL443_28935, partial [Cyclobacteriaceae bacterium]|nr:hypothetical protein [Cyclobacteriaceae bacterium]
MNRLSIRKYVILLVLITVICMEIRAQVSTERSALSNIHKQKWDKVESQLIKVIKKDSVNAVARYVF